MSNSTAAFAAPGKGGGASPSPSPPTGARRSRFFFFAAGERLHLLVVARRHRERRAFRRGAEHGGGERGALRGVRTAARLVQQDHHGVARVPRGGEDAAQAREVRAERGEPAVEVQALRVAQVRQHARRPRHGRGLARVRREVQAGARHEQRQPQGLERRRLAACVRTGDGDEPRVGRGTEIHRDDIRRLRARPHPRRRHLQSLILRSLLRLLGVVTALPPIHLLVLAHLTAAWQRRQTRLQQERVLHPGEAQRRGIARLVPGGVVPRGLVVHPEEPRRLRREPVCVFRARGGEVQVRERLRGAQQRLAAVRAQDLLGERAQHALGFRLLLGGELHEPVVQWRRLSGLLEHGRARPRGAEHDAVHLALRARLHGDALAPQPAHHLRALGEVLARQEGGFFQKQRAQGGFRRPPRLADLPQRIAGVVPHGPARNGDAPPNLELERRRNRFKGLSEVAERLQRLRRERVSVVSVFGTRRRAEFGAHRPGGGARRGDVRERPAGQDAPPSRAQHPGPDVPGALERLPL